MAILRFRKLCYVESAVKCSSVGFETFESPKKIDKKQEDVIISANKFALEINKKKRKQPKEYWGRLDSCFWIIGYLCTTWWLLLFFYHCLPVALFHQVPELPGVRLKREGLKALHPMVFVPGLFTGGLELWEGRPCADGLFRKRLSGSSFTETFKRPLCWSEHLSLHNETGLDPPGIRVRAVPELSGDFVWSVLIKNLAKIGYERKNLHMVAYDWRLSFQNTEIRDHALSRLKHKIELIYITNGYKKVVVLPHSMGAIYFLHFLKWVETPPPMGGGGGPAWCAKHIKAIVNISPPFLGVPSNNILSAEDKDVAYISLLYGICKAIAAGVLDSEILRLQTLEHVLRVTRTWDSIVSLMPKGGETIWGNMDGSPQQLGHVCNRTTTLLLDDLLGFVAPKRMQRAESHFSHGIADNLDDPKYTHYKYWSNPLEMKLPNAPDMEIYCLYGVGIPNGRSYVYKVSSNNTCKSIPYQIDSSFHGEDGSCLKGGVYFADGDESVAVLSAGFMCGKGWRGRTRFNPSGIATYIREYMHKPPAAPSLVEGRRGIEGGRHVDIMRNVALIEDILRIAAGATGKEMGGDMIYSDILKMSERINLQL